MLLRLRKINIKDEVHYIPMGIKHTKNKSTNS